MADIEKVKTGLFEMLQRDTWKDIDPDRERFQPILNVALALLKEQQAEIEALKTGVTWRKLKDGDQVDERNS